MEIQDLSLWLKQDGRPLLEHFSMSLLPGDKTVIIGEEGNGKSTLLKYLYDPALTADYCHGEGRVVCRGKPAYLPQTLPEALWETPVEALVPAEGLYAHPQLPEELGLSWELLLSRRPMGKLSGGEKVKVQLASLLCAEPDVLLLDEPTNDLDIETLEWLEGFLQQTRLPVLYISHDETLIRRTATRIVHLEQLIRKSRCRATVTRAGYDDYLAFRRSSFAHQAQVAQKQRDDYDRQLERWRQIYQKVEQAQGAISRQNPSGGRLLKKKMHSVLSMERRFTREKEAFLDFPEEEEAIVARFDPAVRLPAGKLTVDFSLPELRRGDRVLARDILLQVKGGGHIGITGKNGAGKSTLLAALRQSLLTRRDITLGYMPQNYSEVLPDGCSATEYLAPAGDKESLTLARTRLGSLRFTHEEMTCPLSALSGGQRAKVLLLDMVLRRADVLLLDEPTRNFSPLSGPVVRGALAEFGGAIVSVSHDRSYLEEVCQQVYVLTETGLIRQK